LQVNQTADAVTESVIPDFILSSKSKGKWLKTYTRKSEFDRVVDVVNKAKVSRTERRERKKELTSLHSTYACALLNTKQSLSNRSRTSTSSICCGFIRAPCVAERFWEMVKARRTI
jgi:ribosomal protein L32